MQSKTKPKKQAKSNSRKGGQPGNTNALKHGFYAKRFNQDETQRLKEAERLSIEAEIDLLRVCIDRLAEQLDLDFVHIQARDQHGAPIQTDQRDDHYLKQLNTLSIMTQSLATLLRTHYLTKGKDGAVEKGILEALEELRLEMGL